MSETGSVSSPRSSHPLAGDAYFDVVAEVSRFFSHNLGNLLTGLGLTLDMLTGVDPGDPRGSELVGRAVLMMERLSTFKESWSGLGDAGSGRFEMREPVALVHNVLKQARLGDEYTVVVTGNTHAPAIFCHVPLLTSALHYLVRNAVDAMPAGGALGVDVQVELDRVKITVWDAGPGIPLELRGKILYEPVTTKPYGGGIGLMLVAMIARRVHQGDVRWAPRAPTGCSFELTLPTCGEQAARSLP